VIKANFILAEKRKVVMLSLSKIRLLLFQLGVRASGSSGPLTAEELDFAILLLHFMRVAFFNSHEVHWNPTEDLLPQRKHTGVRELGRGQRLFISR
jgi:hypothetical protein